MKKNQIKLGIILSYFNFFVTAIMGLLYIPYLIRILPDNEYGIYLLMYSFMSLISVLDLGMTGTVTRYYSKYDGTNNEKRNSVIGVSKRIYSFLSACIFITGMVAYISFESIYKSSLNYYEINEAKKILLLIVINAIILIQSNIYIAVIQAKEKFVFQRSILLTRSIIMPITSVLLTVFLKKAIGIFIANTICNFCFYICYRLYVNKKIVLEKKYGWDSLLFNEIMSFAFFLFLNTVTDELFWNTDSMILGAVGGTSTVAVYGTANTIVTQFRGVSSVIHGIYLPRLTKLAASNDCHNEVNELFLKISKVQFFIVFLIYSGFLVFGKEFVLIWAGKEFINSYYLALITMTALLIPLTQSIAISILRAYNKQRFRAILYIILAVLNVVCSMAVAKKYQGFGCAIVTAFFLLFGNVFIMNFYYKNSVGLNIKKWWTQFLILLLPVFASILLAFKIKQYLPISSIMTLFMSIVLYCLVYSAFLFIFNKVISNAISFLYKKG